jgi:hypothetical protein
MPTCGELFYKPDMTDITGTYVWIDYPMAAPGLTAQYPNLGQAHPTLGLLTDVGSWCDPSLWWPLTKAQTEALNIIAVSSEMADMGCQYFGNGKSLFYNGRDLGFKAFARVALSVADTCSTGCADDREPISNLGRLGGLIGN